MTTEQAIDTEHWIRLQEELKQKLIYKDPEEWTNNNNNNNNNIDHSCRYVAGLDISYEKDSMSDRACVALVILDLTTFSTVYEDTRMVHVTTPYCPGFLSFREVDFLLDLIKEFHQKKLNEIEPDVWLVDGNGIMHPRGFGLASNLGVLIDRPTIGVAKNYYHFVCDDDKDDRHHQEQSIKQLKHDLISKLNQEGDTTPIFDSDQKTVVGVALKSSKLAKNPIYVSIGHRISLETAVAIVRKCCRNYKNPEPLRIADMISRKVINNVN